MSSISKDGALLAGHAKDPVTAGLSLDALLGKGYFGRTGGHVLCFGAGGSSTAIALHLAQKQDRADRPRRVIVVNRFAGRLVIAEVLKVSIDEAMLQRLAAVAGALCQPALPGSCDNLTGVLPMDTTRLSTKGQIILPKGIRDSRAWGPGTEFTVEETGDGIVLRPAARFPGTDLEEVAGCLRSKRKSGAPERMRDAIGREVMRRHARGRY